MRNKNSFNRMALVFAIAIIAVLGLTIVTAMAQETPAPEAAILTETIQALTEQITPPVAESSKDFMWIVVICAVIALIFCVITTLNILKKDEGTDKMKEIAAAVREGANAYLKRQYSVVAIILIIVFGILWLLVWNKSLA